MAGLTTQDRVMLAGLAALRLGFAGWMLATPSAAARAVGLEPDRRAGVLLRAGGVREAVLGAALLSAARTGRGARAAVTATLLADTLDTALFAVGGRRGLLSPAKARNGMLAAGSGVLGEGVALLRLGRGSGR